ncbi:UDP-N-acetylmuramate dehydrogenase [Pseudoramibacter alactolyticus ATCC 23263]|uniref:UDP-N-acetylenolpyruvoylglucosamine reductase n=2 Tax=Pseudoramibacter TaxID=113286 RepID=E6ME16_9FIRM|nr:UDP-N-acetylmuramate dehydrogenase [Pseudoramibacter alactolyticus]EFV02775.1 UDP-N-acetylmuramate dehydrogenase [Pseudoramibacter alactolyticus ATCC 23263]
MNKQTIRDRLMSLLGSDHVLTDTLMKDHTSFRVGGPADFLVRPETIEQFIDVMCFCRTEKIPSYLIGNGSNLLVRDGGFRGVIIQTRGMDQIVTSGDRVTVYAGALLRRVAAEALAHGLSGMEFAAGIPGSMGGAIVMNAGAYGGEMKDIVESITVLTETGNLRTIAGADCDFGYRHSVVQDYDWIVVSTVLKLAAGDPEAIAARMKDFNRRRRDKQPLNFPSAGSTFRRPEGHFAGKLIQDAGMKGYRVGGAQVSEKHSGFVINADNATAADILALIGQVQAAVRDRFGVELKTEVITIGEEAAL